MSAGTLKSRRIGAVISLIAAIGFALYPVHYRVSQLGFLFCCAWMVFLTFTLVPVRARVIAGSVLALIAGVLGFWPSQKPNAASLSLRYLKALRSYEGTNYVWGGEGPLGIDCSGLLRRSLRDALFAEAVATMNPTALRTAIAIWSKDTSAKAMRDGAYGWTREVTRAMSLNDLDHQLIKPGDLAVTESGLHVLAYLGDKRWIQADPIPMKVHVAAVPGESWFRSPVRLMRWTFLEPH